MMLLTVACLLSALFIGFLVCKGWLWPWIDDHIGSSSDTPENTPQGQ